METDKELKFPDKFFWGSASSAHQVEGANSNSDWWAWEQQEIKSPKPKIKDVSGAACDHYNRFREDFDWIKELGQNSHRFGIEWARIQPSENEWSSEAVAHYKAVIEALRERNIEPFVTTLHFSLPRWVADYGGWLNPKIVDLYVKYVQFLVDNFGDNVKYWFTLNEPLIAADMGFRKGEWPPVNKSIINNFYALKNMAKAHKAARLAMKLKATERNYNIQVGGVHNLVAFLPYDLKSKIDVAVAGFMQKIFTGLYLWFFNAEKDDFIAINYYFATRIHFALSNLSELFYGITDKDEIRTDMGWTVRPEGLYEVLKSISSFKKTVYITENGIADAEDKFRASFIISHLKSVHRAISEGIDVKGYFYWSLTDNFEWVYGYAPRFGLLAVDYSNFSRTARKSAFMYKDICQNNRISNQILNSKF